MRPYRNIVILLFIGCFFYGLSGFSQSNFNRLRNEANKLIYENPERAIEIAQSLYAREGVSTNDKVSLLLIISTAYSSKRDYNKSLEYALKTEEFLPLLENEKQKMNILNRIGGQYEELQIYDKSIEYLDDALEVIEAYPHQDSVHSFFGYNYTLRGFIYREQMNCDIALRYFDKAITSFKKTLDNPMMNANVSICYYNHGNCMLTAENLIEAKKSFEQSLEYAAVTDAKSLMAYAKKGLADVQSRTGNPEEAILLLKEAHSEAADVGDLRLNQGLYERLSNNFLALGDWENYTKYRAMFIEVQQATKNSERSSINNSLLNLTESKAVAIDALHNKFRPYLYLLIIAIVLAILLLIKMIYSSEKQMKQVEKQLKH